MGISIKLPWNIHLRGSADSAGRSWWQRRKFDGDAGDNSALLKEQDLDHLGALHEAGDRPDKG